MKVPPGKSLASRPVVKPTCKPGNRSTELGGARKQAVSLSPEKGMVVEVPSDFSPEKADGVHVPEGSSPENEKASEQDTTGV